MDKINRLVGKAFNEFVRDFVESLVDVDKDISNYATRFFEDYPSQQIFTIEVGIQLLIFQMSKYLAVYPPDLQCQMVEKIQEKLKDNALPMHKQWLKHKENCEKEDEVS